MAAFMPVFLILGLPYIILKKYRTTLESKDGESGEKTECKGFLTNMTMSEDNNSLPKPERQ